MLLIWLARRAVKAIKPLGCLAMIDDGELDWKVGCVDVRSVVLHGEDTKNKIKCIDVLGLALATL